MALLGRQRDEYARNGLLSAAERKRARHQGRTRGGLLGNVGANDVAEIVMGALPGSGDVMAARDSVRYGRDMLESVRGGDYGKAGSDAIQSLVAAAGALPMVPYLAGLGIKAYHGSPHKFDKFDMSKIGTGEGAQAYGHGLYFAESPDVANEYRQRLAEISAAEFDKIGIPPKDWNAAIMFARSADETQAAAAARDFAAWTGREVTPELEEAYRKTLSQRGHKYTVDIDADPADFLDWDLPLSEQPERAKSALFENLYVNGPEGQKVPASVVMKQWRDAGMDPLGERGMPEIKDAGRSGADIWQTFVNAANRDGAIGEHLAPGSPPIKSGQKAAMEALRRAGIKGIRYKDAASRGTDGGTYNYVVFDDELVKILERE